MTQYTVCCVKNIYYMERAMGIEPTSQAWEARILPMYYARKSPNQSNLIFVNQFIQKTIMKFSIFQ